MAAGCDEAALEAVGLGDGSVVGRDEAAAGPDEVAVGRDEVVAG